MTTCREPARRALFLLLLLLACSPARRSGHPLATCGAPPEEARADLSCLSLQLRVRRLDAVRGALDGTVAVRNRCNTAVALIAAPIDVGPGWPDEWERFASSAYARLRILTGPGGGLVDRGYATKRLPDFVVVPAGATSELPLHGAAAALRQLPPQAQLRFCTFAAPAGESTPTAKEFDLGLTRQRFEERAAQPCPVALRPTAQLVCASYFLH
jgi:hypothetical protein